MLLLEALTTISPLVPKLIVAGLVMDSELVLSLNFLLAEDERRRPPLVDEAVVVERLV